MKSTLVAVAQVIGASALPMAALSAIGGASCIIFGSVERSCATADYASQDNFDLRAYAADFGAELEQFESRFRTRDFGDPLRRFRSDEPRGCIILLR